MGFDGNIVRTVAYPDAKGATCYPQTPMRIRLGNWAGGDPTEKRGTIEWAGGQTDFTKDPFIMYVKSVELVNYNPAESYVYSDKSGSLDNIKINGAVAGKDSTSLNSGISTKTINAASSSSSTSAGSKSTTDSFNTPCTLITYSSNASRNTVLISASTSVTGSLPRPARRLQPRQSQSPNRHHPYLEVPPYCLTQV